MQNKKTALFGLQKEGRVLFAGGLFEQTNKTVIVVTETDKDAHTFYQDLLSYGVQNAVFFPSRDFSIIDASSISRDGELSRISALGSLLFSKASIVCCSVEAFVSHTMPVDEMKLLAVRLDKKTSIDIKQLSSKLVNLGFVRMSKVDGKGQFSVRGGIVDVFSASDKNPVRLDFFGDEITDIFEFDILSQRRIKKIKHLDILPAREVMANDIETAKQKLSEFLKKCKTERLCEIVKRDIERLGDGLWIETPDRYLPLFYRKKQTIADYVDDKILFFSEYHTLPIKAKALNETLSAEFSSYKKQGLCEYSMSEFYKKLNVSDYPEIPHVYCDAFARSMGGVPLDETVNINSNGIPRIPVEFSSFAEDVKRYTDSKFSVVAFCGTIKTAKTWRYDLNELGISASLFKDEAPKPGHVSLCEGSVSGGFEIPSAKLAVVTGSRDRLKGKKTTKPKKAAKGFGSLEDLHKGDLVVHANHGIGRFDGIHRIEHHDIIKDYIKIKYRGEDVLFVPVTLLDLVSPYISPKDKNDRTALAKLNSNDWAKTKQQVYRSVREMAKELIALYSERERAEGFAFDDDGDWQSDFEARFPYDETDDQISAITEVKKDMQKSSPMDRLVCGDVGVGKTEVALRAAFKCVASGKQVAVLVPTTILAWQHFGTFSERMEHFPLKISMLSRFSTKKQLEKAIVGIKNGTVDIAVGTHRLLQKDINFKDLGLLIVDEEQRFGVAHKEKLKETFKGVDVLTLSATPIPRTLNMAMSGIRDMSIIEQPPIDRSPVMTYVIEHDEGTLDDAIKRELSRGGQVYYLYNRVETIDRVAFKLKERFPDAEIEIAHGKMSEQSLSSVWQKVTNNECDILVCTTIIETGIDVANANTLIVENADTMGLSQLYQIRGRVGRSSRKAYAYFTFKKNKVVSEIAAKRLSAIRDFTSFGSGFKIALQDLQIRGAGSVLSARQSGHMEAVGYETYIKILEQAIDDEKGIVTKKSKTECVVDLSVEAYISERYIEDIESRLDMYKKIAAVENREDGDEIIEELRDRFGEPRKNILNLISVSLLRRYAAELNIYEIRERDNTVLLYTDSIDPDRVVKLIAYKKRKVLVSSKGKSYISVKLLAGEDSLTAAIDSIEQLNS